jgi:hypothetical protein
VVTLSVTAPLPVPEAGLSDNQVAVSLATQVKVPLPVLLMFRVCAVGLLPPCWAVKDRLVGLAPIVGLTETTGAAGGAINCANPGISAANLLIDRPPAFPLPEVEELPEPAAASGRVPVDTVPVVMDLVAVADDGAMLMVARGTAAPTVLLSDDGSLDSEVVLSLCGDGRGVGDELAGEEVDGEGSTDATGGFCGLRISWCGLRGAIFSMRCP